MFSDTHQLIAANIFEIVKSELGIELDYDGLRYGSILPDIHPLLTFVPHFFDGSIDLVEKRIMYLENSCFNYDLRKIKRFSVRLGIIIHFICDYFCVAHNEKRYNNLYQHYLYELKLKKFFRKYLIKIKDCKELYMPDSWEISVDLRSFVELKHEEYNLKRHSMTNDLLYSMQVSLIVALNVVSRSILNEERVLIGNLCIKV